eukprot:4984697-Amphidinium_carterae.1
MALLVGETPFPVSFLRLRYLPVPSGYRKRSAQALERRATRKLQRLQTNSLEEAPLNNQCSEAASAATEFSTPSATESHTFESSMREHVGSLVTAECARDFYITGDMISFYYVLHMMPIIYVFDDVCSQVIASPNAPSRPGRKSGH